MTGFVRGDSSRLLSPNDVELAVSFRPFEQTGTDAVSDCGDGDTSLFRVLLSRDERSFVWQREAARSVARQNRLPISRVGLRAQSWNEAR